MIIEEVHTNLHVDLQGNLVVRLETFQNPILQHLVQLRPETVKNN